MQQRDYMPQESKGVITGCFGNHEWILPWWWMNYSLHNTFPVSFINFGDMSAKAISWCSKRGQVINLDINDDFIASREKVDPSAVQLWESIAGPNVWFFRKAWLRKPLAIMLSPYEKTIWFDSDCQIRGPIDFLFQACENPTGIATAEENPNIQAVDRRRGFLYPDEIEYNAGVLACKKNSEIIFQWCKDIKTKNHLYYGDNYHLCHIFFDRRIRPAVLSPIYNWRVDRMEGFNDKAIVIHWIGKFKEKIKEHIDMMKKYMFIDLTI